MIKKYLLLIPILLVLGTLNTFAEFQEPSNTIELPNIDIWSVINKFFTWFFAFVIMAAVAMIIWAGYEYITAGGDSKKTQIALNRVIYALVGIGVALLAKTLILTVCNFVSNGSCSFFQF
ncbi:MAG: pilin [Minisyncoccia bacterium]